MTILAYFNNDLEKTRKVCEDIRILSRGISDLKPETPWEALLTTFKDIPFGVLIPVLQEDENLNKLFIAVKDGEYDEVIAARLAYEDTLSKVPEETNIEGTTANYLRKRYKGTAVTWLWYDFLNAHGVMISPRTPVERFKKLVWSLGRERLSDLDTLMQMEPALFYVAGILIDEWDKICATK